MVMQKYAYLFIILFARIAQSTPSKVSSSQVNIAKIFQHEKLCAFMQKRRKNIGDTFMQILFVCYDIDISDDDDVFNTRLFAHAIIIM